MNVADEHEDNVAQPRVTAGSRRHLMRAAGGLVLGARGLFLPDWLEGPWAAGAVRIGAADRSASAAIAVRTRTSNRTGTSRAAKTPS